MDFYIFQKMIRFLGMTSLRMIISLRDGNNNQWMLKEK